MKQHHFRTENLKECYLQREQLFLKKKQNFSSFPASAFLLSFAYFYSKTSTHELQYYLRSLGSANSCAVKPLFSSSDQPTLENKLTRVQNIMNVAIFQKQAAPYKENTKTMPSQNKTRVLYYLFNSITSSTSNIRIFPSPDKRQRDQHWMYFCSHANHAHVTAKTGGFTLFLFHLRGFSPSCSCTNMQIGKRSAS